jgi:hypothetical protein
MSSLTILLIWLKSWGHSLSARCCCLHRKISQNGTLWNGDSNGRTNPGRSGVGQAVKFADLKKVWLRKDCCPPANVSGGRVEDGRGSLSHAATPRFPSPLIEPDVRRYRIRLSDGLHRKAHGEAVRGKRSRASTPRSPWITS